MARVLSWLLLLISLAAAPAAAATRVELLTVGPGDETYSRFGHTAVLVSRNGKAQVVYNYGLSDFDRPGLPWEFLRGRSVFWVARQRLGAMVSEYSAEDRAVWRQPLALTRAQVSRLLADMASDALPQNREYVYHHFKDNCATRPRDRIDRALGGVIARQLKGQPTGETFRDVVRRGFAADPAILVATEILAGRRIDRPMDRWQAAFLPLSLSASLRQVRLADGRPVAPPPTVVRPRKGPDPLARDALFGVKLVRGATAVAYLLALATALLALRRSRWAAMTLALQALPAGICGLLIWGLCAVSMTPLPELGQNELALVFWPTDLLLLVTAAGWARGNFARGRLLRLYVWVRILAVVASLGGHALGLLHQEPRVLVLMGIALVGSAWAVSRWSRQLTVSSRQSGGSDGLGGAIES